MAYVRNPNPREVGSLTGFTAYDGKTYCARVLHAHDDVDHHVLLQVVGFLPEGGSLELADRVTVPATRLVDAPSSSRFADGLIEMEGAP